MLPAPHLLKPLHILLHALAELGGRCTHQGRSGAIDLSTVSSCMVLG